MKKNFFNSDNIRKTRSKLMKDEKLALNEMKSWEVKGIRVQDKGSIFN